MPLHFVWRDSGVCQRHGFEPHVDMANVTVPGLPVIPMDQRAPKLLDGTYDFLSGLHVEPYQYRARGDKRLVYLAQTQNDWDDRIVARQEIRSPLELEGKTIIMTATAPCVFGNLKHTLQLAGVDPAKVNFVPIRKAEGASCRNALDAVLRGEAVAVNLDIPFDLQGTKEGLHRLETPSVPVIHNTTICANRDWVEGNEETTLAYLRSIVDTIHFFKTQPSKVCEILNRTVVPLLGLRGPDEVEYLQQTWAALLSPKPYPHPLAVWNVYNLDVAKDPDVNFIGPFDLWDTSLLRVVDDSEYIDELYGGALEAANPPVNVAI
jgi:hypothetical protein